MQSGILIYALLGAVATGLLIAAFTDLRRREIDNWLTDAIALVAPLFWLASRLSLGEMGIPFAIALVTFNVLVGLFALNKMGGGDVSRFQRKSKPATAEENAAKAAQIIGQVMRAASAASGVPAQAAGGAQMMRPRACPRS